GARTSPDDLPGDVREMSGSGLDRRHGTVVGPKTVLEVCATRFPCRTFTEWIGSEDWMTRFVQEALPGAYLRVIVPGDIGAGDTISTLSRPEHGVTSGVVFRAMTREPELLPLLAEVEALSAHQRDKAARRARGGARI
ncbi:MOSC domain-containing protein, partial [Streptomyces virginiae]|uniref:MOSC domain-containing protein n=1 Tax=Streptomyces virginiae TaxID=1961 RepID=UPI0035D61F26